MVDVGNTPSVKVDGIYAKMECTNPMGSIKDRLAKYIIEESERRGLLRPGMEIVEASSGNAGISSGANYLVARRVAEARGTTVTVFPDGLSKYRSMGLKARGPCLVDRQCKCPIREVCGKEGDGKACDLVDTDC